MKKIVMALLMAFAMASFAGTVKVPVSGPMKVLPEVAQVRTSSVWAADTAYTQGAYVYDNGLVYMCVVAGTSGSAAASSAPRNAGVSGLFKDTNGITMFYRVPGKRNSLTIQNLSGGDITIQYGFAPGLTTGIVLQSGGYLLRDYNCPQGEVWVNATGATVSATEE